MARPRLRAGSNPIDLYSAQGHFLRQVTFRQAKKLVAEDSAWQVCRRCGRQSEESRCSKNQPHDLVAQMRQLDREREMSPSAITSDEALLFALGSALCFDSDAQRRRWKKVRARVQGWQRSGHNVE
jgi:hypothetical protein